MLNGDFEDESSKHLPQNRTTAASKLRRGGKHCPVCLTPLLKNATRTKRMKECKACGANPHPEKLCVKCSCGGVWQSKQGAACQACGLNGNARAVIVDADKKT